MSNPVEDTAKEGDMATKEGAKGDSRVDVATGDVGGDRDGNK